ncbi:MAG: alpha/beta-type small acid-soluble spore protein [Clostridia bacterium]|nr:alpha/beta-type small acid-soluble spore protein [Clostridia bacterium]
MSSSNTQSNSELKSRLQNLKMEAASSMNVNLKQGYNGDITSREAGSVGGEMVKRMIAYAQQNMDKSGGNMMK